MIYSLSLSDFAMEIANSINALTQHVRRLQAWDIVIKDLNEAEQFEVLHEFVESLGTVALGLPYAVRSRFIFAAGHLCHQANMSKYKKDWKDNFPYDETIYLHQIEVFCSGWRKFGKFKLSLEKITNRESNQKTNDFRNAYNHRFPSWILIGHTNTVRRQVSNEGSIQYSIGPKPPLGLANVIENLKDELDKCYSAFERFQDLVFEHINAISTI